MVHRLLLFDLLISYILRLLNKTGLLIGIERMLELMSARLRQGRGVGSSLAWFVDWIAKEVLPLSASVFPE